ncbi:response regulator transcription factor [Ktedonobacteria bacterium brp13]|nr:response regulator transcription factor [Ktedonobacteria bacterium brp13]
MPILRPNSSRKVYDPRKKGTLLQAKDISVDLAQYRVCYKGKPLELQRPLLFELLIYFLQHPGETLTREHLLEHVWGYSKENIQASNKRTVTIYIHLLREALDDLKEEPRVIQTVYGSGYRFQG